VELQPRSRGTFLSRSFRFLIAGILLLFWMVLITWTTLAIYYSNLVLSR
jgi:hypothetical protein